MLLSSSTYDYAEFYVGVIVGHVHLEAYFITEMKVKGKKLNFSRSFANYKKKMLGLVVVFAALQMSYHFFCSSLFQQRMCSCAFNFYAECSTAILKYLSFYYSDIFQQYAMKTNGI